LVDLVSFSKNLILRYGADNLQRPALPLAARSLLVGTRDIVIVNLILLLISISFSYCSEFGEIRQPTLLQRRLV
jgi:hypothetical protein